MGYIYRICIYTYNSSSIVSGEVSPSGQLARAVSQAARHHRHVVHVAQGLGHLDQRLLLERVHTGQCRGAAGAGDRTRFKDRRTNTHFYLK